MIVQCGQCEMYFDDCYRSTICPHQAFPANDGHNNFTIYHDSYLNQSPPQERKTIPDIN